MKGGVRVGNLIWSLEGLPFVIRKKLKFVLNRGKKIK